MNRNVATIIVCLSIALLSAGCATSGARKGGDAMVAASPSSVKLAQSVHSWDGALLPAYPAGQPEITILRIEIPAGSRLPLHHHPVINAGYLTRGELTVETSEGKTLQLKAGDAIVEVVDTVHHGYNSGDTPAEIVVFYAGVVNSTITVLEP